MKCKCGCENFYTEKHTGLYCESCGKWQKWLSKDEVKLYEHNEHKNDSDIIQNLKEFIDILDKEIDKQYENEPLNPQDMLMKCTYATAYEKVKVGLKNILDGRRFCDNEN